jgi:hypothetical protein
MNEPLIVRRETQRRDHPGLTRHTLVLGSLAGLLCLSEPTL